MKAYLSLRSLELLQLLCEQRIESDDDGRPAGVKSRDEIILIARRIYQQVVDND